jgi:hypothetical protein
VLFRAPRRGPAGGYFGCMRCALPDRRGFVPREGLCSAASTNQGAASVAAHGLGMAALLHHSPIAPFGAGPREWVTWKTDALAPTAKSRGAKKDQPRRGPAPFGGSRSRRSLTAPKFISRENALVEANIPVRTYKEAARNSAPSPRSVPLSSAY